MFKHLVCALLFVASSAVQANIIINGTRVVYLEQNNESVVQLINKRSSSSLVQAWIDDGDIESTPETADVPFLVSPPVARVAGGSGQQLRIQKIGEALPLDRESVFYLNVLDIPPTPEHLKSTNRIQLAVRSRIKLFYRPLHIQSDAKAAIDSLSLEVTRGGLNLVNKSAFFITIIDVGADGQDVLAESVMLKPFSSVFVESTSAVEKGTKYKLRYVDDLGAYETRDVIPR